MNAKKIEKKRTKREQLVLVSFGANLREARNELGYSQEYVANLAGFSRSYYTEIETGKRNISLINIVKIAAILDVDLSMLIKTLE